MSWILDVVVIAVFALSVLAGFRKGFLDSIIGFVGLLAALVIAFFASGVVADGIYKAFVEPPVKTAIVEKIGETGTAVREDLEKAEEALPGFVKSLMEKNEVSLASLADKADIGVSEKGEQLATMITENVVRPPMTLLIRCIAFIVLFIALVIVCGFLGKILGKIIKHTPFKGPDKLLGGVLGAVKGLLWVVLLVTIMQMVAGISADDALISKKSIEETKVVKAIAEINPIYSDNNIVITEFNNLFDK